MPVVPAWVDEFVPADWLAPGESAGNCFDLYRAQFRWAETGNDCIRSLRLTVEQSWSYIMSRLGPDG